MSNDGFNPMGSGPDMITLLEIEEAALDRAERLIKSLRSGNSELA